MDNVTLVMYHYVRDLKYSRYPGIKGLDLDLFKEQIKYLMKHYSIISMEELIYSLDNDTRLPKKSVLLTFDDAYMDHYLHVFPILDKYKIQGSFYVPVKAILEHIVLDVNKIHFILASIDDKSLIVQDLNRLINKYKSEYELQDFDYYYNKLAQESRYDTKDTIFIKRLLQVELVEELRLIITNYLFEKYVGVDEGVFSRELYMNSSHLEHMLRSGMHIGNHGYNHYWWNSLNECDIRKELSLSTNFLINLGVTKNSLTACYPYGSYDEQSRRILKEMEYKLAVTTDQNIANTDAKNRFLMPRLDTNDIPKDSNAETNDWYYKG